MVHKDFTLFPEEVPIIEPLHIHQKMIDERKVGQRNSQRHNDIYNSLSHLYSSLRMTARSALSSDLSFTNSAGTLNTGKPIKEPEPHRTGDVKNHLAYLRLHLVVFGYRFHLISLYLFKILRGRAILDRF
jgi:hypothetical protein